MAQYGGRSRERRVLRRSSEMQSIASSEWTPDQRPTFEAVLGRQVARGRNVRDAGCRVEMQDAVSVVDEM